MHSHGSFDLPDHPGRLPRTGGLLGALPRRRHQAGAVDVRGRHRQRHGTGETLLSVAPHPVEATVLQAVDGRPARGVGAPRPAERLPAFPDAVRLRQPAFPRHGVGPGIPAGPNRSGGLCGPRSKLTTDRSGNRARASAPMGTARSTSLPSHMTERCGRNP